MRGKQRYLCKDCGLSFTDTPPRGKPLALKVAAVLLYVSGLSMNRTAKLLGVSTPTIQAWLEQFAAAYAQKPEPEGRAVVIELDEMWHYLKKSPNPSGSGKLGTVRHVWTPLEEQEKSSRAMWHVVGCLTCVRPLLQHVPCRGPRWEPEDQVQIRPTRLKRLSQSWFPRSGLSTVAPSLSFDLPTPRQPRGRDGAYTAATGAR